MDRQKEIREYYDILAWALDQVGDSEAGYARWGPFEKLSELTRLCAKEFSEGKPFSLSVEELRGALFFVQRSDRFTDSADGPGPDQMAFARALFEAVRRDGEDSQSRSSI